MSKFICGSFIINAKNAFINGSDTIKENKKDVSMPKVITTSKSTFPYVSAQCYRSFWKSSFKQELSIEANDFFDEKLSFINSTDDIFGYFECGSSAKDSAGIIENFSLIRSSPLQISQLHSLKGGSYDSNLTTEHGFVHLKGDTPLPYSSKFYSSHLESIMAIDLSRIGVFRNFNDRQELSNEFSDQYIKMNLLKKIDDNQNVLVNNYKIKTNRIRILLQSLVKINGGAKSAQYATDITPKIIVLAGQKGCNPILSNLVIPGLKEPIFLTEKLFEIVIKHQNLFTTSIYVGIRNSSVSNIEELRETIQSFNMQSSVKIVLTSPVKAIDKLLGEINYE